MPPVTRQRIDKWLWFARIVKTRQLAVGLVEAGHVRINRHRLTKPGHTVAVDDVLTLSIHGQVRVLKVAACAGRRGPAPAAQLLYQDLAMSNPDGPTSQKKDASGAGNC